MRSRTGGDVGKFSAENFPTELSRVLERGRERVREGWWKTFWAVANSKSVHAYGVCSVLNAISVRQSFHNVDTRLCQVATIESSAVLSKRSFVGFGFCLFCILNAIQLFRLATNRTINQCVTFLYKNKKKILYELLFGVPGKAQA